MLNFKYTGKKMIKNLLKLSLLSAALVSGYAYDQDETHSISDMPNGIAPQYPTENDTFDFNVGAAYTYWVPYQNGMILLYNNGVVATGETKGKYVTPFTQGQSGFKVHIGMTTPHDGWNVFVNYTWFNNDNGYKTYTLTDSELYSSNYLSGNYATSQARFKNQFNRIDAFLDRNFYVGRYTTLRPWAGILGAFEKQYLDITGEDENGGTSVFSGKQHWWGVGPYAGMEGTYLLTEMFGLYANLGGSLLVANHYVPETVVMTDPEDNVTYPLYISPTYNDLEPMIEASLGLSFDYNWENFGLLVKLAWETQTYFSHNGFTGIDPEMGNRGTYSMQGLTLDFGMQF